MKAYWGVEVQLHAFLTSALEGGDGQLHAPAALPPGKEPPSTHWIWGWVGTRAGLDTKVRRKIHPNQPRLNYNCDALRQASERDGKCLATTWAAMSYCVPKQCRTDSLSEQGVSWSYKFLSFRGEWIWRNLLGLSAASGDAADSPRSFLIVAQQEGDPFTGTLVLHIWHLWIFFLWEFVHDIVYREKVQNVNELCDRIVRAAQCVSNKMLASTWRETWITSWCVSCP
jgi:hypothetical protein